MKGWVTGSRGAGELQVDFDGRDRLHRHARSLSIEASSLDESHV